MGSPSIAADAQVAACQREFHVRLLESSRERPKGRRVLGFTMFIGLLALSLTTSASHLVFAPIEIHNSTLQEIAEVVDPTFHSAAPAEASPEVVSLPSPPPQSDPHIGVYLTALRMGDEKFLRDTIDAVKATGGSAIIFDVKDTYVFFQTNSVLAAEFRLLRPKYDLQTVLKLAKENNLYTIARFVAVKDPGLAYAAPETQIRNPKTGKSVGSTWVDPGNQTVLAYNREILRDLVSMNQLDEINFDYIRYPTEYTEEQVGLTLEEKKEHLEEFLRMAREVVDEAGAETKIGISTYAILGWDFDLNIKRVAQDFVRFAPLVDVISPMAYPASFAEGPAYYDPKVNQGSRMYSLVKRTLEGYQTLLGEEHAWKLRPWIQGYSASAGNIQDEIQAVYDAGACGFTVWSPSNTYTPLYNAIPAVEQPERCK